MSTFEASSQTSMADEMHAIVDAAATRLRASADEDSDAEHAAAEALRAAANSAINAGYSLREIAAAEAQGQANVRAELRSEALERVSQSGQRAREAEAEHHRDIVRAVHLGLSTREIAGAAGVTHGTVRAISNRYEATTNSANMVDDQPSK